MTAAFRDSTAAAGAHILDLENFVPEAGNIAGPAAENSQSHADAILIGQGGSLLADIGSTLAAEGAGSRRVLPYLGTGLWDDLATAREPSLVGGWFAAPDPDAERGYETKYRAVYGASRRRFLRLPMTRYR